jgi:hypothetical protein
VKSSKVNTGSNLAESSKEGYSSKKCCSTGSSSGSGGGKMYNSRIKLHLALGQACWTWA